VNDDVTIYSGYGIAAQALTAVIRAHDGRGPQTMLTSTILKALGLSSPDELIGWTYADPSWARIAALVPQVVSCAEAGDEISDKILVDAAEDLALSVKAVVQRLGLCGKGDFTCPADSVFYSFARHPVP
jgi:N-acetylglucosamine kinase-like BadF-type ATPase